MSHPALADLPAASGTQASWFHHGDQLLSLLEQKRPKVTVEVGTWRGASAIAIARVVRAWDGLVYCVDTWTAGPTPGPPRMLAEAAEAMVARGVAASVRLIPAPSVEAAGAWQGLIDCLYLDADHTEASVYADLCAWWPHVRKGGLVAGDDYQNPQYPGVKTAWDAFERDYAQKFSRVETPDTDPPGMALVSGVKR